MCEVLWNRVKHVSLYRQIIYVVLTDNLCCFKNIWMLSLQGIVSLGITKSSDYILGYEVFGLSGVLDLPVFN